ncbi:hypothetical protein AGMMS49938_13790 [Fibrobacterales bacterium]|nr:hypothetical protein AGMMS49938_13790 [Fibrobacterales bacterium]
MKKTLLIIFLVVVLVGGAFALLNHNKTKRSSELAARQALTLEIPVTTITVGARSVERSIKVDGILAAKRQVTVLSETQGQVEAFYREVGDKVWVGTPLALVDASVLSSQLATAKASLNNGERDLERFSNLAAQGAATQQTVDQLRLAVESSRSTVVALEKQMANTTIKSPQNGVVVSRFIEVGSVLGGGAPTYKVADISTLVMNVGLTENEIVQVKNGMPVVVHIDALSKDYPAEIANLNVAADLSGRYNVEVQLKNVPKDELRLDLAGSVTFTLPNLEGVPVIPRTALVNGVKDPKVYVVEGSVARLRRLTLDVVEGTNAVVKSGLAMGDEVVVTGHQNLNDSSSVRIMGK